MMFLAAAAQLFLAGSTHYQASRFKLTLKETLKRLLAFCMLDADRIPYPVRADRSSLHTAPAVSALTATAGSPLSVMKAFADPTRSANASP